MEFVKMEALGNDFIVATLPEPPTPEQVRIWTDRRRGIGADGVIVASPLGGTVVRMEIFNADGGEAELSGNGLRCVARLSVDRGWVVGPEFSIVSRAGSHRVEVGEEIAVELGPVKVGAAAEAAGHTVRLAEVGNPHAVLFVDDPERAPVAELGARIGTAFPEGVNVEFASVLSPQRLRLRVWERGVGETLACGTGAAAAHAVARSLDQVESKIVAELLGGELTVELRGELSWIAGPANYVFEGNFPRS